MSKESTTPDLVELARKTFEAANRRDVDAMVSYYRQDAVWDMSTMGMGTFSGRAAIRDHFEDWFAPYEAWHSTVEEVRDLGNDIVFTVTYERARITGGSGVIPRHVAFVLEFMDGLIVRAAPYSDIDQGRAAAERLAESRG
jgi:uncharacterized protein (TIGR02246 family)